MGSSIGGSIALHGGFGQVEEAAMIDREGLERQFLFAITQIERDVRVTEMPDSPPMYRGEESEML